MDDLAAGEFREFVLARQDRLFRSALLLTGHRQDAEDLLQAALSKLATKWHTISSDGAPDAYVRTTMYHQWISWWRRHRHGRQYALDAAPEVPAAGDLAADGALRLALANVLRQLTPRQRAVIVLRYYEDLPESEVARILGCGVGTVRSQVHRTLSRLPRDVPRPGTDEGVRMSTDLRIRQALHDLADAPVPDNLADRALRAAGRRPSRRATIAGAGAVVLALTAVGLAQIQGGGGGGPAPGSRPASGPCVQYTSGSNGLPDVPVADWPGVVTAVVAALPDRSDYSMQSGYAWCTYGTEGHSAYAVVNLGVERQAGHLTIDVYVPAPEAPGDCAEATAQVPPSLSLLFCEEAASGTPLTYGLGGDGYSRVAAVYANGTLVRIESYSPITAEQLRVAVRDPDVYATIPLTGGTPTG